MVPNTSTLTPTTVTSGVLHKLYVATSTVISSSIENTTYLTNATTSVLDEACTYPGNNLFHLPDSKNAIHMYCLSLFLTWDADFLRFRGSMELRIYISTNIKTRYYLKWITAKLTTTNWHALESDFAEHALCLCYLHWTKEYFRIILIYYHYFPKNRFLIATATFWYFVSWVIDDILNNHLVSG